MCANLSPIRPAAFIEASQYHVGQLNWAPTCLSSSLEACVQISTMHIMSRAFLTSSWYDVDQLDRC